MSGVRFPRWTPKIHWRIHRTFYRGITDSGWDGDQRDTEYLWRELVAWYIEEADE